MRIFSIASYVAKSLDWTGHGRNSKRSFIANVDCHVHWEPKRRGYSPLGLQLQSASIPAFDHECICLFLLPKWTWRYPNLESFGRHSKLRTQGHIIEKFSCHSKFLFFFKSAFQAVQSAANSSHVALGLEVVMHGANRDFFNLEKYIIDRLKAEGVSVLFSLNFSLSDQTRPLFHARNIDTVFDYSCASMFL